MKEWEKSLKRGALLLLIAVLVGNTMDFSVLSISAKAAEQTEDVSTVITSFGEPELIHASDYTIVVDKEPMDDSTSWNPWWIFMIGFVIIVIGLGFFILCICKTSRMNLRGN